MPSASVVGWINTGVYGFRHSAYCRHWPPSASVRVQKAIMCRSTHTEKFRRQTFLCYRSSCVERLAYISATRHNYRHFNFQAITERTHVKAVDDHCASCLLFSCALEAHLFTYVLAYSGVGESWRNVNVVSRPQTCIISEARSPRSTRSKRSCWSAWASWSSGTSRTAGTPRDTGTGQQRGLKRHGQVQRVINHQLDHQSYRSVRLAAESYSKLSPACCVHVYVFVRVCTT